MSLPPDTSYATSQSWSQAFYEHPENADGILYPSRHDPQQVLAALFDRSQSLLTVKRHGTLRDHLGNSFFGLLDHYGMALL
ncbi:MAG: RES family NAD+ phosphorylase [Gammaproteobacteria bacterium]|nr:RES family NAD+ phosphorylase [Gammaproteobacteria bacterium]MYG65302.1 RES family NAD+ phosphorylase [Gammaproteobacteria bacterium]